MFGMQMDMRDFLNAPNGLSKQSLAVNEREDTDPSQSPLGGKTVGQFVDMIEIGCSCIGQVRYNRHNSIVHRMSLTCLFTWPEIR